MNFEQPPQTNNNKKEEEMKKPSYYEYADESILNSVKQFEDNLGDDPGKLIEMRNDLERQEDALVRTTNKDERHACLDKMHAINRKLNQLGYEEK